MKLSDVTSPTICFLAYVRIERNKTTNQSDNNLRDFTLNVIVL